MRSLMIGVAVWVGLFVVSGIAIGCIATNVTPDNSIQIYIISGLLSSVLCAFVMGIRSGIKRVA